MRNKLFSSFKDVLSGSSFRILMPSSLIVMLSRSQLDWDWTGTVLSFFHFSSLRLRSFRLSLCFSTGGNSALSWNLSACPSRALFLSFSFFFIFTLSMFWSFSLFLFFFFSPLFFASSSQRSPVVLSLSLAVLLSFCFSTGFRAPLSLSSGPPLSLSLFFFLIFPSVFSPAYQWLIFSFPFNASLIFF